MYCFKWTLAPPRGKCILRLFRLRHHASSNPWKSTHHYQVNNGQAEIGNDEMQPSKNKRLRRLFVFWYSTFNLWCSTYDLHVETLKLFWQKLSHFLRNVGHLERVQHDSFKCKFENHPQSTLSNEVLSFTWLHFKIKYCMIFRRCI